MIRSFEDLKPQATQKTETKPSLPWASKVIQNIGARSSPTPSPTYTWYMEQKQKQREGLENELDIAEIRSAGRGFKNKWHLKVKNFPEIFKPVLDGKPFDWKTIMEVV